MMMVLVDLVSVVVGVVLENSNRSKGAKNTTSLFCDQESTHVTRSPG